MKKKTRIIALLLALCLTVGLLPVQAVAAKELTDTSTIFEDIPQKSWYKEAVDYAYTWGLFSGTSQKAFSPNNKMNRAMFVTVLARLDGVTVNDDTETKFSDVPRNRWYTGSVQWAANSGIVNGTSETTFSPNTAISRQQLCTMIVRYAKYKGITLKTDIPKTVFEDNSAISNYAVEAVYACQRAGIVNGVSQTEFAPAATATRAQAAKILMIFHRDYIDVATVEPETPDTPDTPDEPDTPDTPDTPDEPETPDTPDEPDTPEQPVDPIDPVEPEQPDDDDTEDDVVADPNNIELTKASCYATAHTVSPGGEITYTITVKNNNTKALDVTVTDALPEDTTYVSGDATTNGTALTLTASLAAGESTELSYTVKVDEDADVITAPKAHSGTVESEGAVNYVGVTLNETDRSYMAEGIQAISYSENISPAAIVRSMYNAAFTKLPSITSTHTAQDMLSYIFETTNTETGDTYRNMVVPTLYGGSNVIAANFRGASAPVRTTDMIVGDVLLYTDGTAAYMYIYNGSDLLCLENGTKKADTQSVLSALSGKQYAVLRPSLSFTTAFENYEGRTNTDLTQAQLALQATAESYFSRGYRVQYDDTRMPATYTSSADRGEFRWQIGQYEPEDYTSGMWGYLNCAGFTYDIYRTALGHDLGDLYTTQKLAAYYTDGGKVGATMYPYYYQPDVTADAAEREQVEKEFFDTLQYGDLVVVRRSNSSGHVMMYIGNKTVVHSSGSSFDYSNDAETYEPTIRYMNLEWYLFDENATNYVFASDGYIEQLCIVRPLDTYTGTVPQNTLNRMNNLQDILSEKVASVGQGCTVSKGGELTFTFRIKNIGTMEKTVAISDVVPAGTTLKSAPNATINDKALSWSVTVAPGETKEVSYTVTASGEEGSYIYGTDAKVGGVSHKCPKIYIKLTLTQSQQQAIQQAVQAFKTSNPDNLTGLELANAIYEAAGLDAPFENVTDSQLRASLFTSKNGTGSSAIWSLESDSPYYSMVAPTLYGGRRYFTPQQYTATSKVNTDRSRLPRVQDMVVGDLVVAKFMSSEPIYMYIGNNTLVKLTTTTLDNDGYTADVRLMRMMSAYHYYAVLRPTISAN